MADIVIEVEQREIKGKNGSRRLRREGLIPAVLYGAKKPVVPVTVNPRDLSSILNSEAGENTLLKLRLKGKGAERHAMIKDYQVDPVTGCVIHADFIRIELDHKITISVPIRIHGTAPGVKEQGGLLEVVHRHLEVECLPGDIPEHLDIDASELHIGDQVRVEGIVVGGTFQILEEPSTVVVTVLAPRAVEEVAAEEAVAEELEPEAAAEDKKKEEGEEAGPEKGSGE